MSLPEQNTNREDLLQNFLKECSWDDAERESLAGDASFRHYERLTKDQEIRVLMDAPPPHEDVNPFIKIAKFLKDNNLSAPAIFHEDKENGFLLLEDLGDDLFSKVIKENPNSEEKLYKLAIDLLTDLHKRETPKDTPEYNSELLISESLLFTDWYLPEEIRENVRDKFIAKLEKLLPLTKIGKEVLVLRDYHADNLMWLEEREGIEKVGLLDFQDAVIGSKAYDLVSLLEDARRDVAPKFREEMIDYYLSQNTDLEKEAFLQSYYILGAQRNLKILGIFCRLWKRDGKKTYLQFLPRVWQYLEQDLEHESLKDLRDLIDSIVPANVRSFVPNECS